MNIDAHYFRVHAWMNYTFGKPTKCENKECKSTNPRRFEWSHIKGKPMVKDRNSFQMLCPSCHRKYDLTEEQRQKHRIIAANRKFSSTTRAKISASSKGRNCIPVIQKSVLGEFIEKFESVSIAATKTGILQSSISNVLTKRAKIAGGFIWEYRQMS